MRESKPNIVFILMDNLGYGEPGCYGGGITRGAPTPRIDTLATDGTRLLNFNVEARCTPSRSAIMTGRFSIRSGTHSVPIGGGQDGLTQSESRMDLRRNDDGSVDIHCGPKAPAGFEKNWIPTVRGKNWFAPRPTSIGPGRCQTSSRCRPMTRGARRSRAAPSPRGSPSQPSRNRSRRGRA
jgi:arylsulfatase